MDNKTDPKVQPRPKSNRPAGTGPGPGRRVMKARQNVNRRTPNSDGLPHPSINSMDLNLKTGFGLDLGQPDSITKAIMTINVCLTRRTAKEAEDRAASSPAVTLRITKRKVCEKECGKWDFMGMWEAEYMPKILMDNGILRVTFSLPEGYVTGIKYGGLRNVLETNNKKFNRGYWDVVWSSGNVRHHGAERLVGKRFRIIKKGENQTEISFVSTWHPAMQKSSLSHRRLPVNVDRRYVMLRGRSGFYSYAILERKPTWPAADIIQLRAVHKLQMSKFHYMAVSDKIQRVMPKLQDRMTGRRLNYAEAVRLTNSTNPELRGEVDDKYQYSCEGKDNKLHGWISYNPPVGFWLITPSNEFRSAGPVKQELTSHVGPTSLAMFHSSHYAGKVMAMKFKKGEPWKKVFGPYFVHLNSVSSHEDPHILWEKAKEQMLEEVRSWPYDFPLSKDFPKSYQRGSVVGRLQVHDRYVNKTPMSASSAWVGLAPPGGTGSWQIESKGYQFWMQTDHRGRFEIKGIREGNYSLYAWVPGFIGDYKYAFNLAIVPGSSINLGDIVYEPPRNGPTLWEIGIPDRTAAEFFVPEPSPKLTNRLFLQNEQDKFRQYGLWDRYTELYPKQDLVYTVGVSDYQKDWFFAQVPRRSRNMTYQATMWQVIFPLEDVALGRNYTLQLALASAAQSELQVRFNNPKLSTPHFTTGMIGRDNAIARHGIHGLYWLFSVNVESSWLRCGNNTIFLTQARDSSPFRGVMYDYIRLEGPSLNDSTITSSVT
ncbi:hypothetical protein Ancab_026211 [Ancistrocladus abbreviatus]